MAWFTQPETGELNQEEAQATDNVLSDTSTTRSARFPDDERSIVTTKTTNTTCQSSSRNSSNLSMMGAISSSTTSSSFIATTMDHLQRQVLQLKLAYQEQQLQQRGATADLTEVVEDAVADVEAKLVTGLSHEWKHRFECACRRIQALEQQQQQQLQDGGLQDADDGTVDVVSSIRNEMNTLQTELESKIQRATEDFKFRLEAICSGDGGEQAVGALAETLVDWKQKIESNESNIAAELEALRNQIRVDNSMTTPRASVPMKGNDRDLEQSLKESVMDLVSEMEVLREDLTELTGMDGKVEIVQAELLQVKEELTAVNDNCAILMASLEEKSLQHEDFAAAQQAKNKEQADLRTQVLRDMEARLTEFQTVMARNEAKYQENLRELHEEQDAMRMELKRQHDESAEAQKALLVDTTTQLDALRSQFAKQTRMLTETLRSLHQERDGYMEELKVLRREHKAELETTASSFETELTELRDDVESHKAALDQAQSKMRVMQKEREYFRGELKQMKHAKFLGRVGPEISVETGLGQGHNSSSKSLSLPTTPRGSSSTAGTSVKFVRKSSICRVGTNHPSSPGKRLGVSPRFEERVSESPASPTRLQRVSPRRNFDTVEDETRDDVTPSSRPSSNEADPFVTLQNNGVSKSNSTASPNCVMAQLEDFSSLDGSQDAAKLSLERQFQDSAVRVEAPDGGCAQS